jgi:hypothetical protein
LSKLRDLWFYGVQIRLTPKVPRSRWIR